MKKLKVVLLLALIFVAGIFVGVVGTRATVRRWVQQAVRNPAFLRQRIERDLARKLKLDATQQAGVRQVLTQTQQEIRDLRFEFQPRFVMIVSNAHAGVSAVLTPEQRQKFEEMQIGNQTLWRPR